MTSCSAGPHGADMPRRARRRRGERRGAERWEGCGLAPDSLLLEKKKVYLDIIRPRPGGSVDDDGSFLCAFEHL